MRRTVTMIVSCTFCLSNLIALGTASGAEFERSQLTIKRITAIATGRPSLVSSQQYVRVYVNSANWGNSTCRPDAVDVRKIDIEILDLLRQRFPNFNQFPTVLEIGVDDSMRAIDSTCQAVWASIYNPFAGP